MEGASADLEETTDQVETVVCLGPFTKLTTTPTVEGTNSDIEKLTCQPLMGWTKMDGFFKQSATFPYTSLDEEKITVVVLALSGDALAWYRWSNQRAEIRTWEEMKDVFLNRFRRIQGRDLYEQWVALT